MRDPRSLAAALSRCAERVRARDFDAASVEADAAIAVCPDSADLWRLSSAIWRARGDWVRAARDHRTSLACAPDLCEPARVQEAAGQVARWIATDRVARPGWLDEAPRPSRLRDALEARRHDLESRMAWFERPSCGLPCPSQCCYFDDEPCEFGVSVPLAQVEPIRRWLTAQRLDPEVYLACRDASACEAASIAGTGRIDETPEGGVVWYPARAERRAPTLPPDARPRRRDGRELVWRSADARACAFVGDGGCLIHDIGEPPGLPRCREFLCLTAFVFQALRALGWVEGAELAGWAMERLHRAAVPVVLALAERCCQDRELLAAEAEAREALDGAAASAGRCDEATAGRLLDDYDRASRAFTARLAERRGEVRALLGRF